MPPHITHFKMKAKPGERQQVIDLFDRWFRDRRSKAHGFVRADLSSNVNDPDEFMAVACFADKKTYDANSNDPEQTRGTRSSARTSSLTRSGSTERWNGKRWASI